MISSPYIIYINGKPFGKRPPMLGLTQCPVCGRKMNQKGTDPRGYGFRISGFSKHIFACYEKELKKLGLKEGKYDEKVKLHPLMEEAK